jgi:hypothetical protein
MACECKKVIARLGQERDQLATAYSLMHSALIKEKDGRRSLEAERDQLAARVERLSRVLKDCAPNLQNKDELYGLKWAVCDIINESPAASLLLHDAGVLRKWASRFGHEAYPNYENKYSMGHYAALTNVSRMLHEEANRIEQESKS